MADKLCISIDFKRYVNYNYLLKSFDNQDLIIVHFKVRYCDKINQKIAATLLRAKYECLFTCISDGANEVCICNSYHKSSAKSTSGQIHQGAVVSHIVCYGHFSSLLRPVLYSVLSLLAFWVILF